MDRIQKVSTTELTTRAIRQSILSGDYKVGDKLSTEIKLCQQLNVSRTAVREALRILSTEGYIRMIPGRGAFVAQTEEFENDGDLWNTFSAENFKELMDVRCPFEEIATRLAVQRLTPEILVQLEANFEAFLLAIEAEDRLKLAKLDNQFHDLIFKATKNRFLINFGRKLAREFNKYRSASFNDNETYSNAVEPHRLIIEALRNHDEEAAVCAMRHHMQRALEDVGSRIPPEN